MTETGTVATANAPDVRREIRLSLVLAGGSSLAIYMNGVAQELLQLVKGSSPHLGWEELDPSARAYRKVLGGDEQHPPPTRVIVDIFSGTSAGGINALFLAKALARGLDMSGLTNLWIQTGDFVGLLNDVEGLDKQREGAAERAATRAKEGLPAVGAVLDDIPHARKPKSLLSGDVMYVQLVEALAALDCQPDGTRLVDGIDCYLTTTDLRGTPVKLTIANRREEVPADELVLKARFRFRQGTAGALGLDHDDLDEEHQPLLAFAARATSAHPVAFHPAQWKQCTDLYTDPEGRAWVKELSEELDRYLEPNLTGDLTTRWFSDGGDIDNKPFSWALEPLRFRRADVPVTRKVVFVEPDPSRPDADDYMSRVLPKLAEYTAGTFSLGRQETIRQDIEDIQTRNDSVARLSEATEQLFAREPSDVLASLSQRYRFDTGDPLDTTDRWHAIRAVLVDARSNISRAWRDQSAASIIADGGSATYAFERYRYQTVVQLIAAIAQRVNERERADLIAARCADDPQFDPATLPAPPILADVAAVVEAAVARLYPVPDDGSAPSPRQFLVDFDIWFRLRRLTFLECLLASWQRDDGHAADFGLARGLRGELNTIYFDLRNELEDIDAGDGMSLLAGDVDAMVEFLQLLKLRLNSHDIPDHASYTTLGDSSINARKVIAPDDRPDESSLDLRAALTEAWANYDRYDQFVLPMWSVAQGEMNQIEVVRISPFDATQLLHEGDGRAKLGGTVLGHFGAFLDEDWRRNDILWGRLDATEVILGHILRSVEHGPEADETEAPEARVRRLQQAILEEYVIPEQPIPGRPSADDLRSVLKVDANGTDGLHALAKQALDNFCTEGVSTPADVAEAFYELLHTSWTVDHESVGDRKKQKAGFVLRASRVVGRLLRYQKVNPWPDPDATGEAAKPGKASFVASFAGSTVRSVLRGSFPDGWRKLAWVVGVVAGVGIGVWGIVHAIDLDAGAFGVAAVAWSPSSWPSWPSPCGTARGPDA